MIEIIIIFKKLDFLYKRKLFEYQEINSKPKQFSTST